MDGLIAYILAKKYVDSKDSQSSGEVYVGDTEPNNNSAMLWVDTSDTSNTLDPSNTSDASPTSPITNLTGVATSSTIYLSWSTSIDANSYKIYLNNSYIDNTTNSTYTLTNLNPETTYSIGVIANGNNGDSIMVTIQVTTEAQSNLPSEYQQVNYVISKEHISNVSGIFSDLKNSEISKVEMCIETDWDQYQMIWYSADSNNMNRGEPYVYNTINKTAIVGKGYDSLIVSSNPDVYAGQIAKVDFVFNITSNSDQYIYFGGSEPATFCGSDRNIYYIKVYDLSDNLVRDYIPCYRKSDGTVGMYDKVQENFVYPAYPWDKGSDV